MRRVAVCGGSGGSLMDAAAAAGADVLLTSDLKHHSVSEWQQSMRMSVCDVAHFASEWPWLPVASELLERDLSGRIEASVSRRRTDPWTAHVGQSEEPAEPSADEDRGSASGEEASMASATGPPVGSPPTGVAPQRSDRSPWNWLLLVPIVVVLLVPLYNKVEPTLGDWPLFYWLQLAFVALGVATTALVYRMTRRSPEDRQAARDAIARDAGDRNREV